MIHSILFICTGNSCRSVMAEGLARKSLYEVGKDGIEVSSAGMRALGGLAPTSETIQVMNEEGIDVADYKSRSMTPEMIKKADLIIAMEPVHKDEILRLVPAAASKTFLLKEYKCRSKIPDSGFSVHDPIGKSIDEYRITRDEIKREVGRIADSL